MGKLIKMHLPPKIIRLGYSTRSTIEKQTHMFSLFFYFWLFNNFQPRYKLFFQGVRKLLAKIVLSPFFALMTLNPLSFLPWSPFSLTQPSIPSLFGQRPRQGTKSCRMGRNSVRTYVRTSVHPYVHTSVRPPQGLLAGPQVPLVGLQTQKADGRTYGRTEFLPILQDFVPCRGRCPKRVIAMQISSRLSFW